MLWRWPWIDYGLTVDDRGGLWHWPWCWTRIDDGLTVDWPWLMVIEWHLILLPDAKISLQGANACFPRFIIILRIINNSSTIDRTAVSTCCVTHCPTRRNLSGVSTIFIVHCTPWSHKSAIRPCTILHWSIPVYYTPVTSSLLIIFCGPAFHILLFCNSLLAIWGPYKYHPLLNERLKYP